MIIMEGYQFLFKNCAGIEQRGMSKIANDDFLKEKNNRKFLTNFKIVFKAQKITKDYISNSEK